MDRLLPGGDAPRVLAAKYKPAVVVDQLGQWIRVRKADGSLDPISAVALDGSLGNVSGVIGGCERIATTPLPLSYAIIIHRTVYIYCLLLPFGLVDSAGWMTPVFALFVAYAYMSLEALAAELEDPFGTSNNDLPLEAISRGIESSLLEIMRDAPLPDLPIPENYLVI